MAKNTRQLPMVIDIPTPCAADWEAMVGDARVRHCALCNKDVHALSDLSEARVVATAALAALAACSAQDPSGTEDTGPAISAPVVLAVAGPPAASSPALVPVPESAATIAEPSTAPHPLPTAPYVKHTMGKPMNIQHTMGAPSVSDTKD